MCSGTVAQSSGNRRSAAVGEVAPAQSDTTGAMLVSSELLTHSIHIWRPELGSYGTETEPDTQRLGHIRRELEEKSGR